MLTLKTGPPKAHSVSATITLVLPLPMACLAQPLPLDRSCLSFQ